jgi:hypothetical protein
MGPFGDFLDEDGENHCVLVLKVKGDREELKPGGPYLGWAIKLLKPHDHRRD